jgi:hypothetical protein
VSKPLETEQTKRRKRTSGVRTIRRLYIQKRIKWPKIWQITETFLWISHLNSQVTGQKSCEKLLYNSKSKTQLHFQPSETQNWGFKKKTRGEGLNSKGNPFLLQGNGIHKHSMQESEVIPGEEKGPKGRVVWFRREQNEWTCGKKKNLQRLSRHDEVYTSCLRN